MIYAPAGFAALPEHPSAIHVRLRAPLEWRIATYRREQLVDRHAAEKALKCDDQRKKDLVRSLYHVDIDDARRFSLVLDASRFSSDRIVEILLAAGGVTALRTDASRVSPEAALPFHMEAWMPESIAIVKLRGFVHDAGGEVVESVPGLIKVRLGGRKGASGSSSGGPLSWLGLRRASGPVDVELHLHHLDPTKDNQLTVHVLFRPSHPALLTDRNWRQRCTQVFIELRAYLMGRSPE